MRRSPIWITRSVTDLHDRLPDDFSRQVLAGSLRVVADRDNPIALNLFAAGIRELFGHLLHSAAPDDDVRACDWFEQNSDTPTITRRQRAIYATQGGFNTGYIESLGVDVSDLHKDAIKAIEHLNKATHVRPGRLESDHDTIKAFTQSSLEALVGLLDSIDLCQDSVREALQDQVYEAMMMAFVTETFDTIDLLAGKGYEVDPWIDDAETHVISIGAHEVLLKFTGIAHVTLHYGNRNDAAEVQHDFPFWMTFTAPISDPTTLTLTEHHIDDRAWFE